MLATRLGDPVPDLRHNARGVPRTITGFVIGLPAYETSGMRAAIWELFFAVVRNRLCDSNCNCEEPATPKLIEWEVVRETELSGLYGRRGFKRNYRT